MPKIWPADTIRELLALANAKGESRATLSSAEEARLFRFAVYSFRKAHHAWPDLSVTLDDNVVIVRRRPTHVIDLSNEIDLPICSE